MNRYTITFPFQGEYFFAYVTANQLANAVLQSTDDILNFKSDNIGEDFNYRISCNSKEYDVTFSYNKPQCVNIYDAFDEEGNEYGYIVEKEIPWLLVKIENQQGDTIYSLSDNT